MIAHQTHNPNYIIGIDPDVERSGVAILHVPTRTLSLQAKAFPNLLNSLVNFSRQMEREGRSFRVVVEDSWSKGGNWHVNASMGIYKIAAMGEAVGRCHEVGILVLEWCAAYGIQAQGIPPLPLHVHRQPIWSGKDGKITHAEFVAVTGLQQNRTNQEERDAGLLAWHAAGFPICANYKNTPSRSGSLGEAYQRPQRTQNAARQPKKR